MLHGCADFQLTLRQAGNIGASERESVSEVREAKPLG
jgi:hypothetical protein